MTIWVLFWRKARFWVPALLVLGIHFWLVEQFLPVSVLQQTSPLSGDDFDTHIGQAYRLIASMAQYGQQWSYSPHLLGGFPAGAIFDADNKGWSYTTYALWQWAGLSPGQGFNAFVFAAYVLPPVVGMTAAWLFELTPAAIVLSGLLCSLYWFFDSFVHWCIWVGMMAYATSGYLSLVPLGLFYRFIKSGRYRYALLCAPLMGAVHAVHPYTFFILAVPMAAMYLRRAKSMSKLDHGAVVLICTTTLAMNASWLWVSLRHWHYILNSAYYAQGGLSFLAADLFNLLVSPTDTGVIATRATLRFAYGLLAAGAIYGYAKRRDERLWSLGIVIIYLYAASYLGAYVPGFGQVQPYRHVIPAGFLAALPASSLIVEAVRAGFAAGTAPAVRMAVAVCVYLSAQHVISEAGYFLPNLEPEVQPILDGNSVNLEASGYAPRTFYALPHEPSMHSGVDDLVGWSAYHVGSSGRMVVEEMTLGERIAWRQVTEVIGGFRLRNLAHSLCNILRTHQDKVIREDELRRYVQIYGVTHFVMWREHHEFDRMPNLLESLGEIHGRRVYRVRIATSKIRGSEGRVRAFPNRIVVRETDPKADLMLSYHYHPALRCRPKCRMEPASGGWKIDAVDLIRVPAPHPATFEIYNSYNY